MVDSKDCLVALNPTDEKTLHVHSTNAVLDANCGIVVNSTNPGGLYVDSGSCLRGASIGVSGGAYVEDVCTNDDYSSESIVPEPVMYVPPEVDPLGYLSEPIVGSCPPGPVQLQISSDAVLPAGDYCKGLKVDNGAQVTLLPGVYNIQGETFDISGTDTKVTGDGVMLYFTDWGGLEGKGLKVGSASAIDLSAPTSGDYEGILIFVDRDLPFHTADISIESGSSAVLNGVVYAKNQIVRVHSNASTQTAGGGLAIVADTILVTSSDTLLELTNDFSSFASGSPLKRPTLVE